MRLYIFIWLLITSFLSYEYWALVNRSSVSFLLRIQKLGWISQATKINTEAGGSLSLWLGWAGLTLMIIMNFYSLRKRMAFMQGLGSLSGFLDFHIFCGLLGPMLIFFHCNLKARGVVSIAFWSMIVSFTSGIIGRYFYIQIVGRKSEIEARAERALNKFNEALKFNKIQVDERLKSEVINKAIVYVGGRIGGSEINPIGTLLRALIGDVKVFISDPHVPQPWPAGSRALLRNYAIHYRRARSLMPFQRLMGYWHTFHFPFAIFMYIAALIHVVSSLIFQKS